MDVLILNTSNIEFSEDKEHIIKNVIKEALDIMNLHDNVEISVLLVDDDEMKIINQEFRKVDKPTDVLAFPLLLSYEIEDMFKRGDQVFLGDIIISLEKAMEQAAAFEHSFEREIAFLTAHSMLHLLGYVHDDLSAEKEMFDKQEEILQKAGYSRYYYR